MENVFSQRSLQKWIEECPVLTDLISATPTFWLNGNVTSFEKAAHQIEFSDSDVKDASDRLDRFRPYLKKFYPETAAADGRIESPLTATPSMHRAIEEKYSISVAGRLFIKQDSHLPISGSIKARGGIYEILKFAETVALREGMLKLNDSYEVLGAKEFRNLYSKHKIAVGSTGNLGLSIGIISAGLGFQVTVHMSSDAKEWKKKKLRDIGVTVIEYDADYSKAVAAGRAEALGDPNCHFVDDEDSRDLFLGYSVAGERLKAQLSEHSVSVDEDHPLFVYLPCGVGGGPGGVSYGLKLAFGDNVHCFFGEPTQAPAMLTGLATGLHDAVSAEDLGIENRTIADGLAVSRPSGLVCRTMAPLLSGIFTVADDEMSTLLALLADSENIRLEPSALTGFSGFARIAEVWKKISFSPDMQSNATHIVWATGGSMVPSSVWQNYYNKGKSILNP